MRMKPTRPDRESTNGAVSELRRCPTNQRSSPTCSSPKLSLPRRTFLRGMGATLALPLLEAMVPALTATAKTAANPPRRFGAVFVPHGAVMGTGRRQDRRANFEFTPILKPLEPFRDSLTVVSNLDRDRCDGRRSRRQRGGLADGRVPEADRSRRRPRRHDDRPGDRQADRPGHAVPVARAGDGRLHRLCRRLRRGYSCAYMNTISWANADDAAADGDQPARGVRADVRPGRHERPAPGAHADRQEHPRLGQRRRQGPAGRPWTEGSLATRRLPRQRPRDRSAAFRKPKSRRRPR